MAGACNGFQVKRDYPIVMMTPFANLLARRGDRSLSPAVACAARSGSLVAARPLLPLGWGRAATSPDTQSRQRPPFADLPAPLAIRSPSFP
jgi:hypothetical protein